MSEDKDAKYPGQGGMGEAYTNLHKEQRKENGTVVVSIGNVRRLVGQLSSKDREIATLNRERDILEQERAVLIERIKLLILPDGY